MKGDEQYDFQGAVRAFHAAMGLPVASELTEGDKALRLLRCRLVLEEALEFVKASGCAVRTERESDSFLIVAVADPDLSQMAHELADLAYVTFGSAVSFGFPMAPVFAEVHRANMRKLGPDGKPVQREDGKVIKPSGWSPADVAGVLGMKTEST